MSKFVVEIWSDIICPFCYIGKKKFEAALEIATYKNEIEVVWKSFELSPDTITNTEVSVFENFSQKKGIPVEQAKLMMQQVTNMAKSVGLNFNYDQAVVANTFRAHELLHFAKKFQKQNEVKELLMQGYFTDAKNIDDMDYLVELANNVGLEGEAFKNALASGELKSAVKFDLMEAQQFNITGVPFFVFDRKYAVSGAQDTNVFQQTLDKVYSEWKKSHPQSIFDIQDGESCSADGCF